MAFTQSYRELEDKFRWMVGKDEICHGIESVFLHNVYPTNRVDYVLVGMEPGAEWYGLGHCEGKGRRVRIRELRHGTPLLHELAGLGWMREHQGVAVR